MLERWVFLAVAAAGLALGFWTRAAARRHRARLEQSEGEDQH